MLGDVIKYWFTQPGMNYLLVVKSSYIEMVALNALN